MGDAPHGRAFHLPVDPGRSVALRDLGPRQDACRDPINVVFDQWEAVWRPISNLAHTPFELDGRRYANIEGFWQRLKLEGATERARVAKLWGMEAKGAGRGPQPVAVAYGERIPPPAARITARL